MAIFLLLLLSHVSAFAQTRPTDLLFDFDWRFHLGGAQGAEAPEFDDSKYRNLDLPHDWSIEDLPGTNSPFNPDAISQVNGGFTTGGTGWYRKAFTIGTEQKGKRIVIQFDGVYMNAEVWLNGQLVGTHPYGYTSFWFGLTDKVKFGDRNVLVVKVRNEGENSRWYSGSGIYRHVWLKTLNPTHVAQWGTYIFTPAVTTSSATVIAKTKVLNESEQPSQAKVVTKFVDSKGQEAARVESTETIAAEAEYEFEQQATINSPALWSPDSPALYTAVSEVFRAGDSQSIDHVESRFGNRTLLFDATKGFLLNGQPMKLKGGCLHHDNGPLGARAFDRAEERRVELLKASGYNALRLAHNPPSPAFLEACDRLGMMVIDEAFDMWREGKNPHDYHLFFDEWWQKDIESMITRDRNHPAVIMWSIGNEIPNRQRPEVVKLAQELANYVRKLEPTRPVTSAVNDLKEDKDPYFAVLDVGGYNYAVNRDLPKQNLYEFDHQRLPNRIMFGSESYPLMAFESWMQVLDHPYVIGDFVWTAFDYLGEASIGWRGYFQEQSFYPWNLAYCGDIDSCGWKRPQSYYRDTLWKADQLSVFVRPPQPSFPLNQKRQWWSQWHWFDDVASWNWAGQEGKSLEVNVYSSCEEAELFLNGNSLGKQPTNRGAAYTATWNVPYQAGVLKAVGYRAGKQVNTAELKTAGSPVQIKLTPDRSRINADGQDLSYVTLEVLDDKGVRNALAENLVNFAVVGPGGIVAVG
ncbi:MAG TPA: glycoside hydrolase family 2 TIM barrel-domain containing protein, partial [Pyrinomonadaceae bacterium]|nr:glycoside hydrolase family 2 TIM barrel-domain containing protein [Pyrinomonadaceae bacterium]